MISRWIRREVAIWLTVAAALVIMAIISPSATWWILAGICGLFAAVWPFIKTP